MRERGSAGRYSPRPEGQGAPGDAAGPARPAAQHCATCSGRAWLAGAATFSLPIHSCDLELLVRLSLRLQFATEAAITVLRIDDMVKLEKGEDEMEG